MKFLLQRPAFSVIVIWSMMFLIAGLVYPNFLSFRVLFNIISDNAFLGAVAIGMTMVILSGGIDLSVGSVVACSSIAMASLLSLGWSWPLAFTLVLVCGLILGLTMGWIIESYNLPPFLVTLSGMFLVRGVGYSISEASISIDHPWYSSIHDIGLSFGVAFLPLVAILFLLLTVLGAIVLQRTAFGRTLYAIGGNHESAIMMGLPVHRSKIMVYGCSSLCACLGGVISGFYLGSGNAAMGVGLELDAIAAVVIGGTLLTGGVGGLLGTLFGVMTIGTIQTIMMFDGRLNSWWLRIIVGAMLFVFIMIHKALSRKSQSHSH